MNKNFFTIPVCPLPTLPVECTPILTGLTPRTREVVLGKDDFKEGVKVFYFHPDQIGPDKIRPDGHKILHTLVSSYIIGEDKKNKIYPTTPGDLISNHFGLGEVEYLISKWESLPDWFKDVVSKYFLFLWKSTVRSSAGHLMVPYCHCYRGTLYVLWYHIGNFFNPISPAFRESS